MSGFFKLLCSMFWPHLVALMNFKTIFRLELMFKYVIKRIFLVNIVFLHYDEHTAEICSLLCIIHTEKQLLRSFE